MSNSSQLIGAAVAFLALAPKTIQLTRDRRNPALRATVGVLAGLGVAEILSWYPSYHAIGQISGVPNLARYLIHLCVLVSAAAVQSLFLHLSEPATARARARWRWLLLAVIVTIMGAVFAIADFDVEDAENFADRYAAAPYMREYMLGYLAYLALAMVDIMRMSVHYSRRLPPSALRFGLRVLATGAFDGLLYVIHKATFIILFTSLDSEVPWSEAPVSQLLIVVGIALVSAGLVIPSFARAFTTVRQWPGHYRLHRDMFPLWKALYGLDRSVSLNPPRRRPPLRTLNVEMYRRIIEILDGLRQYGPYLDASAGVAAARTAAEAGLSADEICTIAEAASIAAMVDYLTATPVHDQTPPDIPVRETGEFLLAEEHDVDAARRLAAISRAYATSPIVAAQRTAFRAGRR